MMASCNEDIYKYLHIYYERLFPFKEICTWLSYGDVTTFSRREFSLKLTNELIIRYQAFQIPNQFKMRVLGELPVGIDIGAIYKTSLLNISLPKSTEEKELIFDIDICDYDIVRTCCNGPNICKKCWRYIVIACKILNMFLKSGFDCSNILWIFSGRRGIHCWVCDKNIRISNHKVRKGILKHITNSDAKLMANNKNLLSGKKLDYYDRLVLNIIEPEFVSLCIIDQNLLDTKEDIDYFLSLLPNNKAVTDVQVLFKNHHSSIDKWNAFVAYYNQMIHSRTYYWQGWEEFLSYVMLHYCSPRFDPNVTESITHLLKCPFSVHPGTGRVAIPFNFDEMEFFDPSTTPTLKQLVNEIANLEKDVSSKEENEDTNIYQKTSLKKPVDILKEFVKKIVP